MDFELSEDHLSIRRMVRDFAQKEIAPVIERYYHAEEFPDDIVRKMGELGLFGIIFPEKYGGSQGDILSYLILVEEIGRVDIGLALTIDANVSLAGFLLHHFGSEEQKQQWLVPLAQGKILGSFGLTEPGAGSDAGATATTAVLNDHHWVVNGTKNFITNAGADACAFVIATAATGKTDTGRKETSHILIPKGTPGYEISPPLNKMGCRTSDTRLLSFTDCRVPEENLIGQRGGGLRQSLSALDEGRLSIAAMSTGLTQSCLDLSLSYARERTAFGRPIFEFQAIQFKLVEMALGLELARLMYYKGAMLEQAGQPFTKEAAMAKLFASELAERAARDGLHIHGGYGFMEESPLSRYYRDAKLLTIGEGTSEIERIVIARQL